MFRRYVPGLLFAGSLAVLAPSAAHATFTITGFVKNELGQGIANVDLDFIDVCTGDNVFLVNDKTIASGAFSIVVNPGTYEIHFTPPAGSTVAAGERDDYTVAANADLGTTTLVAGTSVSGTVKNASNVGLAGVDLKFVDLATGSRVWVTKDVTSVTGTYTARVRPGTYDIEYRPPAVPANSYVAARRKNLVVGASPITGLINVLPTGFTVTGVVKDSLSVKIKNVDLNFYDDCTGEKIPTANDNTDVNGAYSINVPAASYSVHFDPPDCKVLASERMPGVTVASNTGLGNTILQPGFAVSGRVLDNLGVPLPSAKLKFYDAATGARLGAKSDNTDAVGHFSILVPLGTYNINVEPPVSRDLLVQRLANVVVAGATALGDTALVAGQPLTGLALGPSASPVQNVNINVVDSVTRAAVILAHDSTNADGTFRVVAPSGTYDVQYKPPACTGLAPDDQKTVSVVGPTPLPAKNLVFGVHATGLVVDDAVPIANPVNNVDLDLYPAGTTVKQYTPGASTNIAGDYDAFIKPNVYDIHYTPPAGSRLRPAQRLSVNLLVDVNLPVTVLHSGWLLSGTVTVQSSGLPVDNAEIQVYAPGGGALAWTPHNHTAVDGTYLFSVDAGTWDLLFVPPAGSGLAPRWRRSVVVDADKLLGIMPLLPLTVPTVASVTPPGGSTAGGQTVTIAGTGFQPDATVRIGGVPVNSVTSVSAIQIKVVSGPHPAAVVAVEVINPGNQIGVLPTAYTYAEPASPIHLSVSRSGNNIVLSWLPTGQPVYTVFRNTGPTGFSGSSILGTTAATTFTDVGGVSAGNLLFYNVD